MTGIEFAAIGFVAGRAVEFLLRRRFRRKQKDPSLEALPPVRCARCREQYMYSHVCSKK